MAEFIPFYFTDEFAPDQEKRRVPAEGSFPEMLRLPHNYGRNSVEEVLKIDLEHEKEPFIVTGYTSLLRVVKLIAGLKDDQALRLLIGNEPFPITNAPMSLEPVSFPEEVQKYWLDKRISLLQYPDVFIALEKIRMGQVDAAYLAIPGRMMHAKMVITGKTAMLGSSNFSDAGLKRNIEANVRFKKDEEGGKRYQEVADYAEALFSLADDYRGHLKALLESLLRPSDWQDCIARACAELLEGNWARKYTAYASLSKPGLTLWPSQQQGIAQALWIIENLGSVLVADATGSGKTRMGTALQRAVFDRLVRTGNFRGGGMSLISPPGVVKGWQNEILNYGLSHQPLSQAALSFVERASVDSFVAQSIKQAQILTVDEAHNYLNAEAKRAQVLLRNLADHVLLFTATPINKSASDLLCLVNILGADNFDPNVIKKFNHWLRLDVKSMREAREEQLEALKSEIARFTVRRTKRELNKLVDQQPDAYRNKHNVLCRYPVQKATPYATGETDKALEIGLRIRQLAERLQGVAYITRTIDENAFLTREGELLEPEVVLERRLRMAQRSAVYQVMSHLRSSRASAYAHIAGLDSTSKFFGFAVKSGAGHNGMIPKLENMDSPPGVNLPDRVGDDVDIPEWLIDQKAFEVACNQELETYREIISQLEKLDDSREMAKLMLLRDLFKNSNNLGAIAFDRHPVTLLYLRHLAETQGLLQGVELLRASGDSTKTERSKVDRYLNNENRLEKNVLALCSDAMSEGYNLQNASIVVHLDMPSVVRLVEQRIGRVDRMDSIHDSITVYWPNDNEIFALHADDLLIERFETNEMLLGSNFYLPEAFLNQSVNYEEIINQAVKESIAWDGIQDAFKPVRALLGEDALISPEHYQSMASIEETCTRVSAVGSDCDWGFFCISGTEFGAPKWVLLIGSKPEPIVDLVEISRFLMDHLKDGIEDIDLRSERCFNDVKSYLGKLPSIERQLLPRRKQVALTEMEFILRKWSLNANEEQAVFYVKLLDILTQNVETQRAVNWSLFADHWLELVRPVWYEKLSTTRGRKAILLSDLRANLISDPIPFERIRERFGVLPDPTAHVSERIAACIIGIKR